MRTAQLLTRALVVLMAAQASTGLLFPEQYRDSAMIATTWFGNDWVTLLIGVPVLGAGALHARRGSVRGLLLWLGMLGYAVYNYAFYLLGSALNVFFLLYAAAVVIAAIALIRVLATLDVARLAARFRAATPARPLGGVLAFVGAGLGSVWIAMWAAHVFAGRPTPVAPDFFRLVAALDLTLMVPALTIGGMLLWRRRPWGFVIGAIASIQGALYLLVLSVNSLLMIRRGFTQSQGELPIWGTLTVVMTIVALVLLVHAPRDRVPGG